MDPESEYEYEEGENADFCKEVQPPTSVSLAFCGVIVCIVIAILSNIK